MFKMVNFMCILPQKYTQRKNIHQKKSIDSRKDKTTLYQHIQKIELKIFLKMQNKYNFYCFFLSIDIVFM